MDKVLFLSLSAYQDRSIFQIDFLGEIWISMDLMRETMRKIGISIKTSYDMKGHVNRGKGRDFGRKHSTKSFN